MDNISFNRRSFLRGLGAYAAAMPLISLKAEAARVEKIFSEKRESSFFYDIHQHYVPDVYRSALLRHGAAGTESDGLPVPKWTADKHLDTLDSLGIRTAFLSLASPHPHWGDDSEAREVVRGCNEAGAELVRNFPERFRLMATLPLPDVSGAEDEISYAYETLHADGVKLPTCASGVYLGDARLEPVFAALNKRKAIVVLHPCSSAVVPGLRVVLPAVIGYLEETTKTMVNLYLSGMMEKYPDIRLIVPHGGALLPSLADRLSGMQGLLQFKADHELPPVKEFLRNLYYDLAGFAVPNQLAGLLQMTESGHMLYGSDYPYAFPQYISGEMKKLQETKLLSDEQKEQIFVKNYKNLFPGC